MTTKLKLRRITTAERATFFAPSQVPQGESLKDEVFQALFVNDRDFQAAPKVFRAANVRFLYIDVGTTYKKIIKEYKDVMEDLNFNLQAEIIGRAFLKDLFFSAVYNSDEGQETPAYLHSQQKYHIQIKTQLCNLGDFMFKTDTQEQAVPCLWVLGATYQVNLKAPISGVQASHEEVRRQVKEFCRTFPKAKTPQGTPQ